MKQPSGWICRLQRIIACVLLAIGSSIGQTASSSSPPVFSATGFPEKGVFTGSSFDSVQMNSGNLHIEIPFATVPGHNASHNYIYHYDNQGWYYHTFPLPNGGLGAFPQPEVGNGIQWRIPDPRKFLATRSVSDADCSSSTGAIYSNLILQEPDGTKHQFFPLEYGPVGLSCNSDYTFSLYAKDGSGWRMDISHGAMVRAVRKDGMQVIFDTSNDNGKEPISIISRNGDMVTRSTDSLGRPLPQWNDALAGQSSFVYTDSQGQPQTINLTRTSVTTSTHLCGESPYMCKDGSGGTFHQPTTIELPNHLKYQFTYEQDQLGEPNSVILPTGGQISWTWGATGAGGRKVTSRTITSGGTSATWTYSWGSPYARDQTYKWQNSMVDPQGNETVYTCGSSNTGLGSSEACQIEKVQYYAGRATDGHLLKTVVSEYSKDLGFLSDRLVAENTILNDLNLVSRVETDWDAVEAEPNSNIWASWQNPLERREYDYGVRAPGKLIRRTRYTYLHLDNQTYKNLNLADLVTSETVYDGDGNIVSQTRMGYDETPLTATSGAPNHDYSNFGASNTIRGNLTSIGHWRSSDGAWLTTKNAYDDLGNLRSTTDPQGHVTSYSYDDKWANLGCVPAGVNTQGYLTKVTNALNQSTETAYYPCTGKTSSHRDQNDINANRSGTTYTYDGMNRPLAIGNSDGGSTSFDYNGDALPLKTTKTELATPSPSVVTSLVYDGLGRVARTSLDSDPEGADVATMRYDGRGLLSDLYYPFRDGGCRPPQCEFFAPYTSYSYDALGRQTLIQRPVSLATIASGGRDTVKISYSGNCTTTTDEAGRPSRRCTDSLGRLIEVDEAGSLAATDTGRVTISGAVQLTQSLVQAGTPSTGYITFGGAIQSYTDWEDPACDYGYGYYCYTTYDSGTMYLTINGFWVAAGYSQYSDLNSIAAELAGGLSDGGSSVTVTSMSGTTAYIVSRQAGANTNYPIDCQSYWNDHVNFSGPSFGCWGSLSGGTDDVYATAYDSGTTTLTINGTPYAYQWNGAGTTAESIASGLASLVNAGGLAQASPNGSTIVLTATTPYGYSISSSNNSVDFPSPSFSVSASAPALDPIYDLSNPSVTLYSYDALGNLTCVVQKGQDPAAFTGCSSAPDAWRPRSFIYDSLSRLTSAHNPESGTVQYSYDDASNLIKKVDARGTTINFGPIDALNRVTKKTYSTSSGTEPAVSYFYDQAAYNGLAISNGIGRRTGMSDASGVTAWSYDSMGRTSVEQQTINGITKSTGYGFDFAGNVINLTYPDGEQVAFGYNGAGRPTSAVDNSLGLIFATKATYDPGGLLTGVVYGSSGGAGGITATTSYNERQQPIFISAASPTQTIFSLGYDFHLGHGDNGNVYQIANNRDNDRTQNFSYDGLNRLQSAWTSGPKWGETFTIDAFGNLTNKGPVAGKNNYEIGLSVAAATAKNQLPDLGYDANGNPIKLRYDANGNLIKNGDSAYVYDAENRITSTAGVTYTYNGDGTRVMRSDGTIDWGPGPLSRSDLSGTVTRNFIFFGGKRIARRLIPANTVDYMFSDHLGSLGVMTDAAGKIEGESDYYPFGGEQVISGGLTAYKFTGKERDTESGLDYFGARYYASNMGRFMSPDWAGGASAVPYADFSNPQSLNLYSYVGNNPLSRADANGHFWKELGNLLNYGMWTRDTALAKKTWEASVAELNKPMSPETKKELHTYVSTVIIFNAVTVAADAASGEDVEPGESEIENLGAPPPVDWNKQEKHFEGHNSFTTGRSTLTANPEELAQQVGKGASLNGTPLGQPGSKERVDFGKVIGNYVDSSGQGTPTTKAIVHYSKDGVHIVPARP